MYRQAVNRLLNEVAETEKFFRAGIVAIDITGANPFTGDRTDHEDEIIGTKKTDEYVCQWVTVQLVGNAVSIVLDTRPVRKGGSRKEIVEDSLDSAEEMVHVDNVLMNREFDSQHVLEMISEGFPTSCQSVCRPAKRHSQSDSSSVARTGMKPSAGCISGTTSGT